MERDEVARINVGSVPVNRRCVETLRLFMLQFSVLCWGKCNAEGLDSLGLYAKTTWVGMRKDDVLVLVLLPKRWRENVPFC